MSYAYNAEMFCDDCANAIKAELDTAGYEDIGDTNEYPQYVGSKEADCPQHCADCAEFLANDLTTDGMEYVQDTINDDMEAGCIDSVACKTWGPFYGISYQPSIEAALKILANSIKADDIIVHDALDVLSQALEGVE